MGISQLHTEADEAASSTYALSGERGAPTPSKDTTGFTTAKITTTTTTANTAASTTTTTGRSTTGTTTTTTTGGGACHGDHRSVIARPESE
ncbi:MAG: hypothetical protein QF749_14295 [Verrucomicrobiota bacterium]|nr:hypothetical protein [Verrucomicrobiota bacterium]